MKHYIVTGASRGVGAAIVKELLGPANTIYAVSRSISEELIASSADTGGSLRWFREDLSVPSGTDRLVSQIARMVSETKPSSIGIILNAAQLQPIGLAGSLATDDIDRAVKLNVVHPISFVQRCIATFEEAMVPIRIIIISSGAAERVMPGLSVYSACKAALNAYTRTVQAECTAAGQDVRIVAVSPGLVDTEMQETLRSTDPGLLPERDTYRSWQREGRLRSPAETAQKILSLLHSDDVAPGSYVHIDEV